MLCGVAHAREATPRRLESALLKEFKVLAASTGLDPSTSGLARNKGSKVAGHGITQRYNPEVEGSRPAYAQLTHLKVGFLESSCA